MRRRCRFSLGLALPCACVAAAVVVAAAAATSCSAPSSDAPAAPVDDPCAGFDAAAPRSVERGRCAVERRACAGCHQSPDAADGVLSGQTTPRPGTSQYPANLTPDPETGLGTWTSDQIVYALEIGLDVHKQPLCIEMPRFDKMGEDEAYGIAHYLKSLPPVHHAIPASTCPPVKPRPDAGAADSD